MLLGVAVVGVPVGTIVGTPGGGGGGGGTGTPVGPNVGGGVGAGVGKGLRSTIDPPGTKDTKDRKSPTCATVDHGISQYIHPSVLQHMP